MATITVIELNHNSWEEIERDPMAFAQAVLTRLKGSDGRTADLPGGRFIFTGHAQEHPALEWREFARKELIRR